MKRTLLSIGMALTTTALCGAADHAYDNDDALKRGYYDRPWLKYEAEAGDTNGEILAPTHDNRYLQSEATHQQAVSLKAQGDYVEWTVENDHANALTLRFSIPDVESHTNEPGGMTGSLNIVVNGKPVQTLDITSKWAWQYFSGRENVAYEYAPNSNPVYRMRFDEVIALLTTPLNAGDKIRLEKADDNAEPYTIDFIELEQADEIAFADLAGEADTDKFLYSGDGSDLQSFVDAHPGKTIYLPKGRYTLPDRLYIRGTGTKLQGAGLFYTELYFNAALTDETYSHRGVESNSDETELHDVYINTSLDRRYYQRRDDRQPGKGLNGSWGKNSRVSNILVQHFECGAWIERAEGLQITHSRFRNNYADGTNLAGGSRNCSVTHSSYRNNGDDDMASWSRQQYRSITSQCENIEYHYNTSECNWRASGVGFFGGQGHRASHIVVSDAVESGLRAVTNFPGYPFSTADYVEFSDISVYRSGGNKTVWSGKAPCIVLDVTSGQYNLNNIRLKNIDVYDAKVEALVLDGYQSNYSLNNICLEDIHIHGYNTLDGGYPAVLMAQNTLRGSVRYKGITINDRPTDGLDKVALNALGFYNYAENNANFVLQNLACEDDDEGGDDGDDEAVFTPRGTAMTLVAEGGSLIIRETESPAIVYNALGQRLREGRPDAQGTIMLHDLPAGAYIVVVGGERIKIVMD